MEDRKRFTITLPVGLKSFYDNMANTRGLQLNSLIILALEEYRDKFKTEGKNVFGEECKNG